MKSSSIAHIPSIRMRQRLQFNILLPTCNCDAFQAKQEFEIQHLSNLPQMFLLKNYLSTAERYTLQWHARNHPKEATHYENSCGRTHSHVSWVPPDAANGIPLELARCSASLLLSEELQSSGLLCEPMQLVHYQSDGEFILHHDAMDRVVTVLCYLNGVAGTWFPLAKRNDNVDLPQPRNKEQALDLVNGFGMHAGQDGLLIAGSLNSPTMNIDNPYEQATVTSNMKDLMIGNT